MEYVVALARIFGPFLAILGLWMLLYGENYMKVINAIKGAPGLMYLSAVINLLIGFTVLTIYNYWTHDWTILVTIFGWLMVLRGVCLLFAPQVIVKMTMTHTKGIKLCGFIPFIWGLLLAWFGYFA